MVSLKVGCKDNVVDDDHTLTILNFSFCHKYFTELVSMNAHHLIGYTKQTLFITISLSFNSKLDEFFLPTRTKEIYRV